MAQTLAQAKRKEAASRCRCCPTVSTRTGPRIDAYLEQFERNAAHPAPITPWIVQRGSPAKSPTWTPTRRPAEIPKAKIAYGTPAHNSHSVKSDQALLAPSGSCSLGGFGVLVVQRHSPTAVTLAIANRIAVPSSIGPFSA